MVKAITPPEEFFGHRLGADRKIARWDRIVEYFNLLQKESDKIVVEDMGPTTEGNPFLLVTISSPRNIRDLEKIKKTNAQIADPRRLDEAKAEQLIKKGKAVICQSMSLHATEIGGTQMAPELAYELITKQDEETKRILDNVVFLMIPSFNPDGQIMVTDWYNRWLGTEYEGTGLPWLYHKYVGHDNNRDAFMTNMIESKYAAKVLFTEWHPHAYQDHHHMGTYGARLFIAPYCEPIRPYGDPLVWRELSWYGAHMAYKLEEAEKTGIVNYAQYAGWGHYGFHWIGIHHNIASMLTESASAKLATPVYVQTSQLAPDGRGTLRGFAQYKPQTNIPHPWPGGWWRLRDIVEQQKVSSWALLDLAARHRETVLRNAYLKAKRQTARGRNDRLKAFVISPLQHDTPTAEKLVEKLLVQGIEIMKSKKPFAVENVSYPAGTYVISLAQPKMGLIRNLLERTFYPDDAWSRTPDGSPIRPYDTATDTMAEFMGVKVDPASVVPSGSFEVVKEESRKGKVVGTSTSGSYIYDGRINDSYKVTNILMHKGLKVRRTQEPLLLGDKLFPVGSFIAPQESYESLKDLSAEMGIDFFALGKTSPQAEEMRPKRVGMYQRYWGGNMDEGWTRFVLEQFSFDYTTILDKDIKDGDLNNRFDVIILPNDPTALITGENLEDYFTRRGFGGTMPNYPPEYRSGIGKDGIEALKKFVQEGGALVSLNQASEFAIEKLNLRIQNSLKDTKSKEFFCPGSVLRAQTNTHQLAYGMPEDILLLFLDSPAFTILPSESNENYEVIVKYPERDLLQSGWLVGEEKLTNKAAMICARQGKGRVILIGFRVQHRAQTHGTFKLLFNALI